MKFVARQDIEAPVDAVFAVLEDHDRWERAAMRRGAEVGRIDGSRPEWRVAFTWRGRARQATVWQDGRTPPQVLRYGFAGRSVEGTVQVELLALGRRHTRMTVAIDVMPRTLAARLFLQSLRLARARVLRRIRKRLEQFAGLVEAQVGVGGGGSGRGRA